MTIFNSPKYCIYLTIYTGNKLPPFYIGSTSILNIKSGYKGSVGSKKYSKIWKEEIKLNPHLFKTKILKTYYSRKFASFKEKTLQQKLKVIKNSLYINLAIAAPKGFFGMSVKGKDHPGFGKSPSEKSRKAVSEANSKRIWKEESLKKLSLSSSKRKHSKETKEKIKNSQPKKHIMSKEGSEKIGIANSKKNKSDTPIICPICGKIGTNLPSMKQWHFDRCKFKSTSSPDQTPTSF